MKQIARKLSSSLYTALLSSALLVTSAHTEQTMAPQAPQNQAVSTIEKTILLEKQSHLQRQFDSIVVVLQTCGQVSALNEKVDPKKTHTA